MLESVSTYGNCSIKSKAKSVVEIFAFPMTNIKNTHINGLRLPGNYFFERFRWTSGDANRVSKIISRSQWDNSQAWPVFGWYLHQTVDHFMNSSISTNS